jgi:DNA-binding XRE family transcriptional regulator
VLVGENLKRLAGMHLLSQDQVGALAGIGKQSTWQIIAGKNGPSLKTAMKWADAFGIDVRDLHGPPGDCMRAAALAFDTCPVRQAQIKLGGAAEPAADPGAPAEDAIRALRRKRDGAQSTLFNPDGTPKNTAGRKTRP